MDVEEEDEEDEEDEDEAARKDEEDEDEAARVTPPAFEDGCLADERIMLIQTIPTIDENFIFIFFKQVFFSPKWA